MDPSGSKVIHTLTLLQEHDSQLASLRVVVDVLSHLSVNGVFLIWNVDLVSGSHVLHIQLHGFYLLVLLFYPCQEILDLLLVLL